MISINRPSARVTAALARGFQARSQGSAAIASHAYEYANENTAAKTTPKKPFQKPIHLKMPTTDFSSVALKRDDGDYYFEAHSEALSSALNSHLDPIKREEVIETTISPVRASATAREVDLVEAAHAARDHEMYDKILILMRHGEAEHNVFERNYVEKNGTTMEEANADEDYPTDPMLTGKVCYFLRWNNCRL